MQVLIFGAGAVGLGIASCLLKSGISTDLFCRKATADFLKQYGLIRTGIFGSLHAKPNDFDIFENPAQIDKKYDFILVCTKSGDTQSAAEQLATQVDILNQDGIYILCQNGWGNAEIFTQFFPKKNVYNARVITGFIRTNPNEVDITVHADSIHIGSLFDQPVEILNSLCTKITDGGIPCQTTNHIERDLWAKMLYNCALNPLGAILEVPYGKLAEQNPTRDIMDQIVHEVFAVMNAAGYQSHWEQPEQYLQVFYEKLVPATADHHPSTLQDLKAGKKTEIDALTGQILKLAKDHSIKVPINTTVYNMIQFKQS